MRVPAKYSDHAVCLSMSIRNYYRFEFRTKSPVSRLWASLLQRRFCFWPERMSAPIAPKTPLRRKSYAPENLLGANDDETEKENLRQQREQNAIAFTPFKGISADKRKSFDVQGGTPKGGKLDAQKLAELYGNCIKLANDNVMIRNLPKQTISSHGKCNFAAEG